eukprot:8321685-Prorocentrum_lima.AAC.1
MHEGVMVKYQPGKNTIAYSLTKVAANGEAGRAKGQTVAARCDQVTNSHWKQMVMGVSFGRD